MGRLKTSNKSKEDDMILPSTNVNMHMNQIKC